MRKLRLFLPVFVLMLLMASCSREEVATRENAGAMGRDSVNALLGWRPLFVAEAYRFSGADSVDLF